VDGDKAVDGGRDNGVKRLPSLAFLPLLKKQANH